MEWMKVILLGATALISVVDGDTVRNEHGALIRLQGFNTPELNGKCEAERELARRARDRLRVLVRTRNATLTLTGASCGYGRPCGVLAVRGVNVGDVLVAEGLAEPMVCPDNRCPPARDWCR